MKSNFLWRNIKKSSHSIPPKTNRKTKVWDNMIHQQNKSWSIETGSLKMTEVTELVDKERKITIMNLKKCVRGCKEKHECEKKIYGRH